VGQVLESGLANAVLDANHNTLFTRDQVRMLAKEHEALGIVVWIDTPLDVAKERTEIREKTEGHKLFEENLVEKMAKRFEKPDDELVIHIDGLADAEDQKRQFDEQFARIKRNTLQ
jgi:predicted kinase